MGIAKRQRSQHNRVHHAEDCDVCPYSKCKNQDGNNCEAKVALQHAEGKAQILPQDVDPRQTARLAMPLKGLLHSTKSNESLTPGFFRRQTTAEIFFHCHFKMRGHLFADFMIQLFAAEERAELVEYLSEGITHSSPPSLMARTRPMTPASRCQ